MKKKAFYILSILFAASISTFDAGAQTPADRLLQRADSARLKYDYPSAARLCQEAVEQDSTARAKAEDLLIMSQNGLRMMDFCSQPVVVAKQTFPLKDFFLFYPLKNNSWRKTPNQLDSLGNGDLARAVYIPEGASDIYYSAEDEDGIRNIYRTFLADSLWSAPMLINEQMTSSSDEIYPMLSPDGKSLYFASKGLYGMGGYDLYVSTWNPETKDWDVPVNMGFPYSSPYDDFLFINSEDGRYSIFASNRECSKDSVCIYVLEYDGMPVRRAFSDVEELRQLAALKPANDPSRMDNGSAVEDQDPKSEETRRYIDKIKEVRSLRDSVSQFNSSLDNLRNEYSSATDERKAELSATIQEKELLLPELNKTLQTAVKELQSIEMDFLSKGIVIDASKLQAKADKEVVGAASGYTFSRNSYGPAPKLQIRKPVRKFDYSFMILPEGRFAEDNSLPEGLVYQIRIFTQSRKATVQDIKGLSPVFEKQSGSKYIYSVGVFRTYKDVLANLNKVKKLGFRTAEITAWRDGQSVSVANARKFEEQKLYTVVIFPENGQSLGEAMMTAIHEHSDKDLVKSIENGSVVFKVGPFEGKEEAEELLNALKALGSANVSLTESD
ncbi:MAG: PD40 domain-containing protein [Bacteroidales bacterium]|nr:PD40 domain-containing protein [Bacteroidales bacterium]